MEGLIVCGCIALSCFAMACLSIAFLNFQKWDKDGEKELERERELKELQEENLYLLRKRNK